jgi:hypothetical protein
MKKIILLAILSSLSGCVVAPAQPGYYGQPYYVQPAPVVVGPAFYVGGGCCWHGGYRGGWRR